MSSASDSIQNAIESSQKVSEAKTGKALPPEIPFNEGLMVVTESKEKPKQPDQHILNG